MYERPIFVPALGAVIHIEVTEEDLKTRKPIETAAKRKFDKQDTWSAHTGLWFRWQGWEGKWVRYAYEIKEEDLREFLKNPQACTLRYERIK